MSALTVIVETDPALPLVELSLAALTGSIEDPPGKEGLTRLTTRLMRRTAYGRDTQALDQAFDTLGASLGTDVGFSSAGFSGSVLRRSLPQFAELARGVFCQPGFDAQELERIKRETQAEIVEVLDDDRLLVRGWFRRLFFQGHPYGRSSQGTIRSVESLTLDDVHEVYRRVFTRANLCCAFSGDIEAGEAAQLAEQLLAELPQGETRASEPPAPVATVGQRLVIVDKPERSQTQILIGCLGTRPSDEDHTALLVANTVFGGTFTARLTQEVRAKRGWSYGAYSSLPIERQRHAFSMWTFPAVSDAAACIELELKLLQEWIDRGITQEELDWVKRYMIRSNVFSSDTAGKRMGLALDERVYDLPPRYFANYPDRVGAVTLDQANAAIQKRISSKDLLIVVVGTAKDLASSLQSVVPDAEVSVVPFDED